MKIHNILKSEECKPLFDEVELFVNTSLSEYNKTLVKGGVRFSDKDIFDFVWGTVNFSAAEMCVLDSPLLQRLRRIRQLGLASTVYCNADSSRFSHTIGVTEVAGRMAHMISKKVNDILSNEEFADYKDHFNPEEIVRLAAIFHDTGHMFYSHVSELFFSYDHAFPRYDEITKAKAYFCEKTSADVSFHELISVMIVNSSETLKLFEIIARQMKQSRLTEDSHYKQLAEFISCLIIGVPTNKYILPYSTIINSAIDADKLDYLSRDSQCTKVPIAVDIARIIQKIDVVSIERVTRTDIWDDTTTKAVPFKIMAIKNSAKNVFSQLSNARTSMYESVYYHHKVLTAETMFRVALRKVYVLKDKKSIDFSDILEITDDYFNNKWEYTLLTEQERKDQNKIQEISKIFNWIRNRDLYKRVAAFSQDIIIAPKAAKEDFLNTIVQDPLSADCNSFCQKLTAEYSQVCDLLSLEKMQDPVFIFIYSKFTPMDSVPVENGDGYCVWSSKITKQNTIEAGKRSKQEQFYLVTDCKDRLPVYLALEKVITDFGILQLTSDAAICSKQPKTRLNQKRGELLELNYYSDKLYVIQDDVLLEKVYERSLFEQTLEKYRSFMGVNNCKINKESLLSFLRQFLQFKLTFEELKLLMNGILKILNEAYYLDRESFAKQFTILVKDKLLNIPCNSMHMVLLGGLFDSAQHLAYFINDVPSKGNLSFDSNLNNTFKTLQAGDCICFFDDGAYSGKQVISIFQELMGISVEQRTTREHHVNELCDSDKETIRNAKIVLAYLCFNKNSENYIRTEFAKLGITNVEICYNFDLSSKIFESNGVFSKNQKQKAVVMRCLSQIGEAVLDSTKKVDTETYKDRWSKDRVKTAALGYNDAQQMVVFYNNIPTYSLTAFWANGKVQKREWKGLFQRTNKD